MIEIDTDSHSEIMGFVEAYLTENVVRNNRLTQNAYNRPTKAASYTLAVKGVQKVRAIGINYAKLSSTLVSGKCHRESAWESWPGL